MSEGAEYLFVASMNVDPAHEATFNDVYDTEHVPYLSEVPGVLSVVRCEPQTFSLSIGGEIREVPAPSEEPRYTALYGIESPEVLTSEAFSEAIERGRWPGQVRPHTRDRRHLLWRVTTRS